MMEQTTPPRTNPWISHPIPNSHHKNDDSSPSFPSSPKKHAKKTVEGSPFWVGLCFVFSQKHLWCLGSRLAVKTAWERYGVEESPFWVGLCFVFSQKHLWCLGSRLAVKTAWERYGVEESADAVDAGVRMLLWRCCCEDVTVHAAAVRMLSCTLLVWRCYREDVIVYPAVVKMLPYTLLVCCGRCWWGWCCAILCRGRCGRCWCDRGCCCAIPCCGRCGRCWCEDVAARYRAIMAYMTHGATKSPAHASVAQAFSNVL